MTTIERTSKTLKNNSSDYIKHDGIIDFIDGQYVRVRIVQTSACSSCKIASHCNASEMTVKTIDVYGIKNADAYKIGQQVTVCATTDMAVLALTYGFVLPLLLLVLVVAMVFYFTGVEAMAALLGLVALVPYYTLLYIKRDKFKRKLRFWIE